LSIFNLADACESSLKADSQISQKWDRSASRT
jgi:hypothetical protein